MGKHNDELDELEAIYRDTIKTPIGVTTQGEDSTVLELARRNIAIDDTTNVISIEHFRKARAIWSGFSVAAGILLGYLINAPIDQINEPEILTGYKITYMGTNEKPVSVDTSSMSREEMQSLIAELAISGHITQAHELIIIFRKRFSDYDAEYQ